MATEYTANPDFELITLAEAKAHLRLDESFDYEDDLIAQYIAAAQGAAAAYMERTIEQGSTVVAGTGFCTLFWDWRKVTVTEVSILQAGETERTILGPSDYTLRKMCSRSYRIVPALPEADYNLADVSDAVRITFASVVPVLVKQACLLMLADFYQYREDRPQGYNRAALNLLMPYRAF